MLDMGRESTMTGEWECLECGYTTEGVRTRQPKRCPECGAPASAFEFLSDDADVEGWDDDLEDATDYEDEDEDEY